MLLKFFLSDCMTNLRAAEVFKYDVYNFIRSFIEDIYEPMESRATKQYTQSEILLRHSVTCPSYAKKVNALSNN